MNPRFDEYYEKQFGSRWPTLLLALQKPEIQVCRWNQFSNPAEAKSDSWQGLSGCRLFDNDEIPRGLEELLSFYVMDPASMIVARALQVQKDDEVLDMCAAPGGKTLILVEGIAEGGQLTADELSQPRRARLIKVIQQYIPRSVRERVRVSGLDASTLAIRNRERFNKILLDAPCSGERHLLKSKKDWEAWTLSRTQKLAQRQYALLSAALEALAPGGRIVYSTCAISPLENDGVVERLLSKKSDRVHCVMDYSPALSPEKTKYGWHFLPDQKGFGPLYFSILERS